MISFKSYILLFIAILIISCTVPKSVTSNLNSFKSEKTDFVLPYNDGSSGLTNFGDNLNHKPAGSLGPLTINSEGHFSVGSERIRFWGVNITSHSCFPDKEDAEAVAKRLAKFGVNIVRFHHMENNWGSESLIDYSRGNSSNFDYQNLDKLDYFIYQLKKEGIYTNINLLTSRDYMVSDGLPSYLEDLKWKDKHILSYILPEVRNLEKEHARKLLTHLNPYTGLSYSNDNSIAIVEINNENSIIQKYLDGSIDEWPSELTLLLEQKWNSWLASKYSNTSQLQQAWSIIIEELGNEMVTNSDFSNSLSSWNLEQHNGAVANGIVIENSLKIEIENKGSANWHIQLTHGGLSLNKNQMYTLSFKVKSDSDTEISMGIGQNYSPWESIIWKTYPISDDWQEISFSFISEVDDNNMRINLSNLGLQDSDIYIDYVSLKPGGKLGNLDSNQSLEHRNIPINNRTDEYTIERKEDWMEFLISLEEEYWGDMQNFLDNEIGIEGLSYGTIVSLSTPSVMERFGFIDAHAYWQHPRFPNRAWDPSDWTVEPLSMVNFSKNTISSLAYQRVEGKPFTVSEYQHSFPNPYSAEAPLMIASYGALQDWDGIYFFAYDSDSSANWDSNYFSGFFQINNNPSVMANFALASNIFRREDISVANRQILLNFNKDRELEILTNGGTAWNAATGNHLNPPNYLAFIHRVSIETQDSRNSIETPPRIDDEKIFESDNSELCWNLKNPDHGFITINSSKTKAILGYIDSKTYNLGKLTISVGETDMDWATIAITAQTGDFSELNNPLSLLIVATGNTENSNMKWKDESKTSLGKDWGNSPTIIEVIPFILELPVAANRVKLWTLDEYGQRNKELPIKQNGDSSLIIVDGTTETLWYEIEIE